MQPESVWKAKATWPASNAHSITWLAICALSAAIVLATPARGDTNFAVVGDYGSGGTGPTPLIQQAAAGVASRLNATQPLFVLSLGDQIYGSYPIPGGLDTVPLPIGAYQTAIGALYGQYMVQNALVPNGGSTMRLFPVYGDHDWWHETVQVCLTAPGSPCTTAGTPLTNPPYPGSPQNYSTQYSINDPQYSAFYANALTVYNNAQSYLSHVASGQVQMDVKPIVFSAPGTPQGSDNLETYFGALYNLPSSQTPSGSPRWYDTLQGTGPGSVHVFTLSNDPNELFQGGLATINLQDPGAAAANLANTPQGQWFQQALAASTATWNIVQMHQPVATSSAPEEGAGIGPASGHVATTYMQWFDNSNVDLVLAGHVHSYERLYNNGVAYIVNGAGGTWESFALFCNQPGVSTSCNNTYQVAPAFAGVGNSTTSSNARMVALSQIQVGNVYGFQVINVSSQYNYLESQFWGSVDPANVLGQGANWTLLDDFFILKNGMLNPPQAATATGVEIKPMVAGAAGGGIINTQGQTVNLNAAITGTGTLVVTGGGTLVLGQPSNQNLFSGTPFSSIPDAGASTPYVYVPNPLNSYTGGTMVTGATTLSIAADGYLGAVAGGLTLDQGTLQTTAPMTSARSVTLASGGGTFQTLANTTLAGPIGGPGGLIKTGSATLTLTGPLSYTGGTAVNAGTLAATTPITGSLTVAGGATLNADANVSNLPLPGGAGMALGAATALVSPGGTINGNVAIGIDGGLINNGLINGSLNNAGVFMGNGVLNGSLVISGLVAPGNSIGTLRVNGNVTFAPGSTYQAQIGAAGQSDLIAASGQAVLSGGTVQVIPYTGFVPGFQNYTILTAQNGVSGQFSAVQGPFGTSYYPFLGASLGYDPNDVYVAIGRSAVSFASAGQTWNQVAAGTAADKLPLASPLMQSLALLNYTSAPAALNSIGGDIYGSTLTTLQQQATLLRDTINLRMRQALLPADAIGPEGVGGPNTAPLAPGSTATVWQQGFGSWGQTAGDGNASSLHRGIGGYLIGVDHRFDNWRAGLATGVSQSNFNTDGNTSQGSSTNYDLAAYGGGRFGAVNVKLGAGYTWHNATISRFVAFPGFVDSDSAKFNAGTGQVFTEIGYDRQCGSVVVEPFAGLAYVNVHSGTFAESGGSARLNGSSNSVANGYSNLGLRAGMPVRIGDVELAAHGMLGWQHAFGNVNPQATLAFASGSGSFSISGAPIARDALLTGAGLDYRLNGNVSFGVRYFGQLGATAVDNTVDGHLVIQF